MTDLNQTLFDRAAQVIPGGVNSPVRAFRAVTPLRFSLNPPAGMSGAGGSAGSVASTGTGAISSFVPPSPTTTVAVAVLQLPWQPGRPPPT